MKTQSLSIEDDKGYAAAIGKLRDLQVRLGAVESRRDEILAELATSGAIRRSDDLTSRALKLLGDGAPGDTLEVRAGKLREEAGRLDEERPVLARAIELQRPAVEAEGARASKAICSTVRPKYRAAVQNVAEKLRALSDALAAEREIREDLISGGVSLGSGGVVPMLGNLASLELGRDEYSKAAWWFKDARESGLIEK